jgi:hypothetical protein
MKGGMEMEILKALKAEQKVLEKKIRAIQLSLKAAFESFHKETTKKASARIPAKKVAHERRGRRVRKTGTLKKTSSKSGGRAPARRAA